MKVGIIQFNRHGGAGKRNGCFATSAFGPKVLFVSRDFVFSTATAAGYD
jgi:hypothetical protein